MIFRFFSKIIERDDSSEMFKDIVNSYNSLIRDLNTGLSRLKLGENFESNTRTVTIASAAELKIPHNLGAIPSGYLILRRSSNAVISDGGTAWDENNIYLTNNGASSVTLTIVILK